MKGQIMVAGEKKRILVADSDLLNLATLIGTLKDNYHVVVAKSPQDIFQQLKKRSSIDMVLLDTRFAGEDGFNICYQLKQQDSTKEIPVIFVSTQNSVAAETTAFEVGAADFITKPFNAPTALARIRNQLKLSAAISELKHLHQLALDANPNTGLPGNNSIRNELDRAIEDQAQICVVYADLDHFKIYNDTYGFAKGDEVIIFTADVIRVALSVCDCADSFVGHIGGDDFVFVVPADKCREVGDEIIRRISLGIPEFYSSDDSERGYVIALNREGEEKQHPLVSLSMGGVDLTKRKIDCAFEIIDICTEMKTAAKKQVGSNILICKRQKI